MAYRDLLQRWISCVDDETLSAELQELACASDEVIEDAFYQELSFGTAGLRGILGAGTNRMNIYTVGKATQGIASYLLATPTLAPRVVICYDSRINSDVFARRAACVLAANGIESWLFPRLEPTPVLSFATRYLNCGIGINVTASHNPSKYNGYKVYGPDGCQITDEIADGITKAIASIDCFDDVKTCNFDEALQKGLIRYVPEEVLNAYLDAVYEQSLMPLCEDEGEGESATEEGATKAAPERNAELAAAKTAPERDAKLAAANALSKLRVVYTPLNGTGLECVSRILNRIGVSDIHVVEEQAQPDGNFPTCPYPNPEMREALELGIQLCEEVHPDLLLATDPDADRVGIAVKDGNEYQLLTGNEVGVLLLDYVCRMRCAYNKMPENPVTVTTIVSSLMVDAVAQTYGVEVRRVLTGFKYIGGVQGSLEEANELDRFVFGFEESYGYLAGSHARDKDAVVTSMLICQMASYYAQKGQNLYQAIQGLYKQYGYFINETNSFTFEGAAGARKMASLMDSLRTNPPSAVAGMPVKEVVDYKQGVRGLPQSNVLEFDLGNSCKILVRPSGTEPKIKVYVFAYGKTREEAHNVRAALKAHMQTLFE